MSVKFKSIFRTTLLLCLLLVCGQVSAQTIAKGTVTDQTGEPVIGATVVEKGNAKNAAVTDFDGNFTLKLQHGKTIVVSYIGMVSQEVTAGPDLKIQLQDDNAALEEVVVVGYTSKARKDLTGSVGSVSGAKLAQVPVASAAEAMQGKIAGVQISTVDGAPGADIYIKIRGGAALGQNNQPLYIVDGFQQDNINDLPPTDIASIDVLKDASLTAIYGARGGNGVVVVTTKSAQQGKLKVEFNAYAQAKKLAGKQDMLDAYEFVKYQRDLSYNNKTNNYAFRTNFGNPSDMDIYRNATTHDWQDELMGGTAWTQMYNATINGGNDKIRFSTSLTHHNENGIIENSGVRRTNMNSKIYLQISPRVKVTINPRFTYRRDLGAGADGIGTGGLVGVLRYRPTNGYREFTHSNEAALIYNQERYWKLASPMDDIDQNYMKKHSYSFTNQASLSWEIIDNLVFRTDIAQFWGFSDQNQFWGYLTDTAHSNEDKPVAQVTDVRRNKYTWTNTLNYSFTVKEDHNISVLLGHEMYDDQRTTRINASRYFPQFISPNKAFANMGLGSAYKSTSTVKTPDRMLSFFGQANYNYKHRYLLSFTFRADGSTKFAPGHQWGYFPSVSGAWVVSEEPWWNKNIMNQLKVRASFGLAGNNDIGDDLWRYQYSISENGGPSWGESTISENGETYYAASNTFPNEKIKWETTTNRNLALDMSFFNGRLTITPEFYWNTTKDLLYKSLIPTTSGYTYQQQNVGQVTNKGVELTINYQMFQQKNFDLSVNATMGYNKTKVDQLNNEDTVIWASSKKGGWNPGFDDFCLRVGEEIGLIYGFVYDGIYTFDDFERDGFTYKLKEGVVNGLYAKNTDTAVNNVHPGDPKFKDLNGDGQIDENDRTVIGNTNPRLQGGFGLSGRWKDFDFNANFVYFLNFDVLNATKYRLSSSTGNNLSTSPLNVSSDFDYASRWVYFGDIYNTNADGSQSLYWMSEQLVNNSQKIQYMDEYERINAGKSLWNPMRVNSDYTHSYFVEDGSFLRLQNVTVGYTLPKKITSKFGVERLRVYFTGSNLFCITKYSGYDPEVDIQSGLTPSVDYNRYPRNRSYLFGFNLSF